MEECTEWVHHLVLAKKPNGAIRICLDSQNLNKVIQREYFQIPTVEKILKQLTGVKVFSTLDANQGFYLIKLTETSSKMCNFSTLLGCYRFLRISFGISSAPEIFTKNSNKYSKDLRVLTRTKTTLLCMVETKKNTNKD